MYRISMMLYDDKKKFDFDQWGPTSESMHTLTVVSGHVTSPSLWNLSS